MMRLDRLLCLLGLGSRTDVQHMIRAGRVSVNGVTHRDSAFHTAEDDTVFLNGVKIDTRTKRHIMLNKPKGVLTAARDAKQPTVLDLLPPLYRACGCMPVGRLDKDTEGLLLFTTDGALSHRLLAPAHHVWKMYEAQVDGSLGKEDIEAFAQGIQLSDFTALPAKLTVLSSACDTSEACVCVREGKFHQVRRMFEALEKHVTALRRVSFGPLSLDPALAPGAYRELTESEYAALLAASGEANE